jgi:hypothetical protein
MRSSNDTFGIRTRDLPLCSAIPQPTASPRASLFLLILIFILVCMYSLAVGVVVIVAPGHTQ